MEVEPDASHEDADATVTDTGDGMVEVVTTGSVNKRCGHIYPNLYRDRQFREHSHHYA